MILQQVSNYELELMRVIWANKGVGLYAEIVAGLEAKGYFWTKNTTITLLSRLVEKGLLKTSKTGRRNIYTSIVTENEYQADQTINFLNKVFEGDTKGLVAALIEKALLSPQDYDELSNYWKGIGTTK
jgi:predicted transcriptional regulator